MNSVNILGRFGQDPELRFFDSGNCRVNFTLAVDDKVKRDGQWVKQPVWVQCEAWGKLASEVIANYCRKGSQVAIVGKLKVETWQDKSTGANRSRMLVNVRNLHMTSSGQQADQRPQSQARPPAPEKQAVTAGGAPDCDEIPFNRFDDFMHMGA